MQRIVPHLWFDTQAVEAAKFYSTVFENSKVLNISQIKDTPSGDCDIVSFTVMGYEFMAISAGPYFTVNPSISFHVKCLSVNDVDELWAKLSPGGTAMMELGEYPFSKRYGWIQDKYGVSWQIIHTQDVSSDRIIPVLMFTQAACGKAEEAIEYYSSIFKNASSQVLARYEKGEEPDKEGSVKYSQFILDGQEFGAMDSAHDHKFTFNEGVSLIVNCKDQQEIDYFWEKLSAVPEAEQCGWVKDKFGVSWQIVPQNLDEIMSKNPIKTTPVLMKMKKIVIIDLESVANSH
jgi:predicted 3-demethylubiquinone-9 3-methyltransferase (glyoxalase superfamily)